MSTREFVRIVIGLLLGVALGAGSVLWDRTTAYSGLDPNAVLEGEVESTRPDFEPDRVRKRALSKRERIKVREAAADRARAAAAKAAASAEPSAEEIPKQDTSDSEQVSQGDFCTDITRILTSLRRQVLQIIPRDRDDTFIRDAVIVAFDGVIEAHACTKEEIRKINRAEVKESAPKEPVQVSEPETIDNKCGRLSPRRRVQCLENERKGIRF